MMMDALNSKNVQPLIILFVDGTLRVYYFYVDEHVCKIVQPFLVQLQIHLLIFFPIQTNMALLNPNAWTRLVEWNSMF